MQSKTDRLNKQRSRRNQAIQKRAANVSMFDSAARVRTWETDHDAMPAKALAQGRRTIYCHKTGAIVGSYDEMTHAQAAEIFEESQTDEVSAADTMWETIDSNHCHPAWLRTSPETLRQLQRLMPHEYVVYAANQLTKNPANTMQRHRLLLHIQSQPIADVIECAELLRRVNGLFQKLAIIDKNLPFLYKLAEHKLLAAVNSLIKNWLRETVFTVQSRYHTSEIARRRVITLADVKNYSADFGSKQFRDSAIAAEDEDELLLDVAELFRRVNGESESDTAFDDFADFAIAWNYHKPPAAVKETRYSGRIYQSAENKSVSGHSVAPANAPANPAMPESATATATATDTVTLRPVTLFRS